MAPFFFYLIFLVLSSYNYIFNCRFAIDLNLNNNSALSTTFNTETLIPYVTEWYHIVVRLPSPCRSCNTKLQSRVNNLHVTIYPPIQDYFRSDLI
jgi:hypothetical protein